MQKKLLEETDMDCVNAAFLLLCELSPESAFSYACDLRSKFITTDAHLLLSAIKAFHDCPEISEVLPQLLGHKSAKIRFEVARLFLTNKKYKHYENACKVILDVAETTSDNTVKAVIGLELRRLVALWEEPVFSLHLSKLTRVILKTVSFDIRSTFLETSSLFLDSDNFLEFIQFSASEISKNLQNKDAKSYRHQLLVVCKDILIRSSSEQVQVKCVDAFMLTLKNPEDCKAVLSMVKEILTFLPKIRELLAAKLCEHLHFTSSTAAALAIWIIGEYTRTEKGCFLALEKIEAFFTHQLKDHESATQKTSAGTKQHLKSKNFMLSALLFSVGKLLAIFYTNKYANFKEFRCKVFPYLNCSSSPFRSYYMFSNTAEQRRDSTRNASIVLGQF